MKVLRDILTNRWCSVKYPWSGIEPIKLASHCVKVARELKLKNVIFCEVVWLDV